MPGSNAEIGIVTTARKRAHLEPEARRAASRLGLPFVPRGDTPFEELFDKHRVSAVYVFTDEGRSIQTPGGRLIFHEGTAALRTARGSKADPMAQAMELRPSDHLLDATLGLGVDALVAAHHLPEGGVTGIECHPLLEDLVRIGLREGPFTRSWLRQAARRVRTVCADHREYLRRAAVNSFDVVYFDPMFAETVRASTLIQRLRLFANEQPLSQDTLRRARRVARRCVVIKGRRGCFDGIRFDRFVPSGKTIFYGVIDAE